MKIVVCIKQVPSTNRVHMDPVTNTIIRDGRQSVTNPFDTHAIEEAVRLKERMGGHVTAVSMGIPATEKLLRDAVSRGVDDAVLLSDPQFAGADTLATAYTLFRGIQSLGGVDVVICGKMAVDGDTAQIGPELAEFMGIPHVTEVKRILEVTKKSITCEKITDRGHQVLRIKLPALVTVVREINMPRMPSIEGVLNSQQHPVCCLDAAALSADSACIGLTGSPTQVVRTFVPQRQVEAVTIEGDEGLQAKIIHQVIREVVGNDRA